MPFDPQTSEMTNRIRQGFGQRGALGIHVDEVAVPVIPIYGLDQAPFRSDGIEFHGQLGVAAVAAQLSGVFINPPVGGRSVLNQIVIGNPEATAQRILWGSCLVSSFSAVGGLFTSEYPPAPGTSTANVGGGIGTANAAAFVGPGQEGTAVVDIGSSLIVPLDWTMQEGIGFFVQTTVVLRALQVSFMGHFWR